MRPIQGHTFHFKATLHGPIARVPSPNRAPIPCPNSNTDGRLGTQNMVVQMQDVAHRSHSPTQLNAPDGLARGSKAPRHAELVEDAEKRPTQRRVDAYSNRLFVIDTTPRLITRPIAWMNAASSWSCLPLCARSPRVSPTPPAHSSLNRTPDSCWRSAARMPHLLQGLTCRIAFAAAASYRRVGPTSVQHTRSLRFSR